MKPSNAQLIHELENEIASRKLDLRFSWKRCFEWLGAVFLFSIISTVALGLALGYRINFATGTVVQTSLIELNGPSAGLPVKVTLNNKEVGNHLPLKLTDLVADTYHIKVERDNYVPWEYTLTLGTNQRVNLSQIILYYKDRTPVRRTNVASEDSRFNRFDSKNLEIRSGNELWWNEKFVTRTSNDLASPRWFQQYQLVTAHSDSELFLIDPTLPRSQSILTYTSTTKPLRYFFEGGGRVLVYEDETGIWEIQLYESTGLLNFIR